MGFEFVASGVYPSGVMAHHQGSRYPLWRLVGPKHRRTAQFRAVSFVAELSFTCYMESSMNFWIYLVGFAIIIAGVAWALTVAGVGSTYVLIAAVILLGVGILTAVTKTRQKDPPA